MPGSNCAIVGCPACKGRHKGLSFHSIPKENKFEHTVHHKWRSEIIARIGRVDAGFNPEKATVCSRHFTKDCFVTVGSRRKLKLGSLPTKFMLPEDNVVDCARKVKGRKTKLRKVDVSETSTRGQELVSAGNEEMDRNIAANVLLLMSEKNSEQVEDYPSSDQRSVVDATCAYYDQKTQHVDTAMQTDQHRATSYTSQTPSDKRALGEKIATIIQRSGLITGATTGPDWPHTAGKSLLRNSQLSGT